MREALWQSYYAQLQKEIASQHCVAEYTVDYGEIIYQSPEVLNTRWLVMAYKGEFNVFVDKVFPSGKFDRNLGASFGWKEKAIEFALEMFLICSGRLRRRDRHSFASVGLNDGA